MNEDFKQLAKVYKLTPGREMADAMRWFLLGEKYAIAECVRRLREHAANDFDTQSIFYYRAAAAMLEQEMKK